MNWKSWDSFTDCYDKTYTTSTKCRWILLRGAGTDRSIAVGAWRLWHCRGEGLFQHIYPDLYMYRIMIYLFYTEIIRCRYMMAHLKIAYLHRRSCIFEWYVHVLFENVWILWLADAFGILVVDVGQGVTSGAVDARLCWSEDDVWNLVMEWLLRIWLQ